MSSVNDQSPPGPDRQVQAINDIQDTVDPQVYNLSSPSFSESEASDSRDLNNIGNFASIRLPTFSWSTNNNNNITGEGYGTYQDLIQSRREQLTNFIDELKEGFSLRSALDRFQTIRTLLESEISQTIENNVDTDSEDEQNAELPQVVKAAVEPKELPLLDQVIIPQTKDPQRKKHRRKHSNVYRNHPELEKLTSMQSHEVNNESLLREKIKAIRRLSIGEIDKSHMIQKLMMGAHYHKIKFVDENGDEVLKIDNKFATANNPLISDEEQEKSDEPVVTDQDKTKTYNDEEEEILGCPHYQRNCKMECPICKKWHGCPICHDEQTSDHKFQRNQTKHILCMNCFTAQTPDEFCSFCDLKFAAYYCPTCKLYDNDETKDIYHCQDCGICRLGLGLGQDFFHCKGCNACLAIELQNDHRCIERSIESDCPICGEFMFTSIKPVVFMSCGHAIHQSCYEDHSKHSYKCPTCQKTVLNMEAQFRVLDMEIRLQPLPYPYSQWSCIIRCNDCNAKSSAPYHVLGLRCENCKSYNTAQLKLIKPEEGTDYESDISTTTNQMRMAKVRDLKHIAINSNHLLNKNFNKEHLEAEHAPTDPKPKLAQEDLNEAYQTDSGFQSEQEEKVLTLPRQFMNNFDQYITNLQEYYSSSDENDQDQEYDEMGFLRVNRTLSKFQHQQHQQPQPHDNEDEEKTGAKDMMESISQSTLISNSTTFLANALNNFLASGSNGNTADNDADDESEDDDELERVLQN